MVLGTETEKDQTLFRQRYSREGEDKERLSVSGLTGTLY